MADISVAAPRSTGTLFRAPIGTSLPTDAVTDLASVSPLYEDLGDLGESGIARSISRDTQKKKAFGGHTVAILQNDYTETLQTTLLDDYNGSVLKSIFGDDNVIFDLDGFPTVVDSTKQVLPRCVWIADTLDNENRLKRLVVAEGQITTVGDHSLVHTDTVEYPITIEVFEKNARFVREYRSPALGSAAAVPVIDWFDPATVDSTGGLVAVRGFGFAGVTGVTVDGDAVEYTVLSANWIVLDVPAGSGTVPVIVSNAAGPSAAATLTYA
ncbi:MULTISPECIES: IPT/TIG domain-containing protein [Rhodococcus]|uniref:IPT/TIG domain-containing protein n=1 Tax=Rhodococcus TaxID=1827 RepID=UPI001E5E26FB|nr:MULTISPECIES: IPT/TIG domain-containing protein [Rhodococcus]BDB58988.1 hypothetical protein RDE2_07820 [Rhodococcus sp. RDE2]